MSFWHVEKHRISINTYRMIESVDLFFKMNDLVEWFHTNMNVEVEK